MTGPVVAGRKKKPFGLTANIRFPNAGSGLSPRTAPSIPQPKVKRASIASQGSSLMTGRSGSAETSPSPMPGYLSIIGLFLISFLILLRVFSSVEQIKSFGAAFLSSCPTIYIDHDTISFGGMLEVSRRSLMAGLNSLNARRAGPAVSQQRYRPPCKCPMNVPIESSGLFHLSSCSLRILENGIILRHLQ